jgi:signal transduction histidine kinase
MHAPRIQIEPNEKVVFTLRKHWIILVRDTVGTIVLAALPFILIALVVRSDVLPFPFSISPALFTFSSALWLLIVWLSLAVIWTNYYLDFWILTDRRIFSVDQIGLFDRRVSTWNVEHIQEISVLVQNPVQAFLDYGTVEVETAGPSDNAVMEGVPKPENVRTAILQQASRFKKLEDTSKKQESLLHSISHEVKGHLARSEAALASIVEEDYGSVPFPVKTIADSALAEARKGVDTVMGILDASNFKTGSMRLDRQEFDVKSAVEDIVKEAQSSAARKELSFKEVISPGSYAFNGDEAKLRRHVFRNLIDNAIRYTREGGVRVLLSHVDNKILFSVKDTGVGITPEDMEILFTEGGKGKDSSEVNPESTGYGLFVAKTIVEAHGGKIWAESEGKGKGAQFFVELPT